MSDTESQYLLNLNDVNFTSCYFSDEQPDNLNQNSGDQFYYREENSNDWPLGSPNPNHKESGPNEPTQNDENVDNKRFHFPNNSQQQNNQLDIQFQNTISWSGKIEDYPPSENNKNPPKSTKSTKISKKKHKEGEVYKQSSVSPKKTISKSKQKKETGPLDRFRYKCFESSSILGFNEMKQTIEKLIVNVNFIHKELKTLLDNLESLHMGTSNLPVEWANVTSYSPQFLPMNPHLGTSNPPPTSNSPQSENNLSIPSQSDSDTETNQEEGRKRINYKVIQLLSGKVLSRVREGTIETINKLKSDFHLSHIVINSEVLFEKLKILKVNQSEKGVDEYLQKKMETNEEKLIKLYFVVTFIDIIENGLDTYIKNTKMGKHGYTKEEIIHVYEEKTAPFLKKLKKKRSEILGG